MKKFVRPAGIVIAILVMAGISAFYYTLGGFNESSIRIVADTTFHLCGVYYEGKANRPAWGSCFNDIENIIKEKELSYEVAAYYDQNPSEENNHMVKAFVGALVPDRSSCAFSDTLEHRTVSMEKMILGEQEASIVITSLFDDIEDFAKEKDLSPDSVHIMEHYPAKDRLIVYWPLQGGSKLSKP